MTTTHPPRQLVYVDSDIPPGMTIHEWRRQRAARPPSHSGRQACARAVRAAATRAWGAVARALAWPECRACAREAAGIGRRAPQRPREQRSGPMTASVYPSHLEAIEIRRSGRRVADA
jgi:hypothetical protein